MNPDSLSRKKPQRLKERLREVTSSAIVEAAEAVFLKHGLQAPMELIAERAGVAVGTLYNHFADRKALVEALLVMHREKVRSAVREAEQATLTRPVREQLLAMLGVMREGWQRIFLVIREGEQFPDAKKRALVRDRFGEIFGPVLERGRKQGAIAEDPDGLQPVVLRGLIHALFGLALDDPKQLPPERVVETLVDFFLSGVSRPNKP